MLDLCPWEQRDFPQRNKDGIYWHPLGDIAYRHFDRIRSIDRWLDYKSRYASFCKKVYALQPRFCFRSCWAKENSRYGLRYLLSAGAPSITSTKSKVSQKMFASLRFFPYASSSPFPFILLLSAQFHPMPHSSPSHALLLLPPSYLGAQLLTTTSKSSMRTRTRLLATWRRLCHHNTPLLRPCRFQR